jgi:hypothetical protein
MTDQKHIAKLRRIINQASIPFVNINQVAERSAFDPDLSGASLKSSAEQVRDYMEELLEELEPPCLRLRCQCRNCVAARNNYPDDMD